jgi:formylglycine-generating enzyme required for sulfatase activity
MQGPPEDRFKQTLSSLQRARRKLLTTIGVLLGLLVSLIAVGVVIGLAVWLWDLHQEAQIKKNHIGMEFVPIAAGNFSMGSDAGEKDEAPAHRVTISHGFLMGRYEVTAAEWKAVMGEPPNNFKGDRFPVQFVTWDAAQDFVRRLNLTNDGYTYRLPTEAEWEYACRAGTTGDFADELDWLAWYDANSNGEVHEVGAKHPNAWGLYDMEGNVWEYCQDRYGESYYSQSPKADPQGSPSGDARVQRGGSYRERGPLSNDDHSSPLRSAARHSTSPNTLLEDYGFRLVAQTSAH